jgi:hypothetical protein
MFLPVEYQSPERDNAKPKSDDDPMMDTALTFVNRVKVRDAAKTVRQFTKRAAPQVRFAKEKSRYKKFLDVLARFKNGEMTPRDVNVKVPTSI